MRDIKALISKEKERQLSGLELIASENFVSQSILDAQGSILTNKYAEGLPYKRYYGGCEVVDEIEQEAIDMAKKLFDADHANVQPHSGSQANAAVMLSCLKPGDTILGFDLSNGGHLTHGSPVNFSGMIYKAYHYGIRPEDGLIDLDQVRDLAHKHKPKMIICGASSYSRDWDYKTFREIADEVGAILLADISHPSGLIAKGLLNHPGEYCHILTTTTHKTLRGPRGGLILVPNDFENPFGKNLKSGKPKKMSTLLDSAVFPGIQGGPLEHVIAAKALAFQEALSNEYKSYIEQVAINANELANEMQKLGYKIISGGTSNHLMLIDLRSNFKDLTGKIAEDILGDCGITINKNTVPNETRPPSVTSGIRIGTPAITTRGLQKEDMKLVAQFIHEGLMSHNEEVVLKKLKSQVKDFMYHRPLFSEAIPV
jgi:glycine hydroxymethyltransferase